MGFMSAFPDIWKERNVGRQFRSIQSDGTAIAAMKSSFSAEH